MKTQPSRSSVARSALAVSLLVATRTSAATAPNSASYDEVDAYVQRQMDHLRIPGASLAIVEGDELVHLRGFGLAEPGGAAPSPKTPFFIGSLTKSITALAVMQLVEAGKVNLDATRGFWMLFMPDFSWIAIVCGGFAGIWTFLRTGLILRALREPPSPTSLVPAGASPA